MDDSTALNDFIRPFTGDAIPEQLYVAVVGKAFWDWKGLGNDSTTALEFYRAFGEVYDAQHPE